MNNYNLKLQLQMFNIKRKTIAILLILYTSILQIEGNTVTTASQSTTTTMTQSTSTSVTPTPASPTGVKTCKSVDPISKYDCLEFNTELTYCCFVTGASIEPNGKSRAEQACYEIAKVNVTDLLPEVIYITTLVTKVKPNVDCKGFRIGGYTMLIYSIFIIIVIIMH